jgi:membrane-associated protease RseP (regulator of RpoE activity)
MRTPGASPNGSTRAARARRALQSTILAATLGVLPGQGAPAAHAEVPLADGTVIAAGDGTVVEIDQGENGPFVRFVDVQDDETGYLGVNIEEEIDHPEGGARVTRIVSESPADEAGIRVGDVIVSFDGHVVRGPAALTQRIHERSPGDKVKVELLRDGAKVRVEVELGRRSGLFTPLRLGSGAWVLPDDFGDLEDLEDRLGGVTEGTEDLGRRLRENAERLQELYAPMVCEGGDCSYFVLPGGRPRLGVQLVEATPELRVHLGGSDDRGVLVSKVLVGTPAERAGIQVGDLILTVDGDPVASVNDLRRALADRAGKTFPVELSRDGRRLNVDVTLPGGDEDEVTGPRAALPPAPPAGERGLPVSAPSPPLRPASASRAAPPAPPTPVALSAPPATSPSPPSPPSPPTDGPGASTAPTPAAPPAPSAPPASPALV